MMPTDETPEEILDRVAVGLEWCRIALARYRGIMGVEPGSAADAHEALTGHRIAFGCCASDPLTDQPTRR